MRIISLIIVAAITANFSFADSTVPFKASNITVDFSQGRKAIFTLNMPGLAHGERRFQIPKVVGVEFVFANGKTAKVPKEALDDIEIQDFHATLIEVGTDDGSWFLTAQIKNTEKIPDRVSNDRVVFVFDSYKYEERWLLRSSVRNAEISNTKQD